MPNTKPIGVAYSDPQLDSITVTGASTLAAVTATTVTATGAVASSSTVTGTALAATTATGLQMTMGNGLGLYALNVAITANSTTTSAVSGSIGITSHATGVGKLFISDGSKWQYAVVA